MRKWKTTLWNNFCFYSHANQWKLKFRTSSCNLKTWCVSSNWLPITSQRRHTLIESSKQKCQHHLLSLHLSHFFFSYFFFVCFGQNAHAAFMSLPSILNIKHIAAIIFFQWTNTCTKSILKILEEHLCIALVFVLLTLNKL